MPKKAFPFLREIDDLLAQRPSDNAISAKHALLKICEVIYEEAAKADQVFDELCVKNGDFNEDTLVQWSSHLFKIQQIICLTPMRHLVESLATDDYLAIRIAAKGELADRGHSADEEATMMANANLTVICHQDQDLHNKIITEANNDHRIQEAIKLWSMATINTGFGPGE